MTSQSIRFCFALAIMLLSAPLSGLLAAEDDPISDVPLRSFSGPLPILRETLGTIELAPAVRVYPGETVTISASGTANVNQHNYEKRRCKYFGMKCWYEKRSDTNMQPASKFEIEIALVDKDGRAVQLTDGAGRSATRFEINDGKPLRLTYGLGPRLSNGLVLHAAVKTFSGDKFSRLSCDRRPEYCSSGGLKITLDNDAANAVSERRQRIDQQLSATGADAVNALSITSRDFLDPLLLNGSENAREMRGVLVKHISRWVADADRNNGNQLVQLIRYGLQMTGDQDQTDTLNQALLDAYGATGAYANVEQSARAMIADLNKRCDEERCSVADANKLAETLRSLSKAQAEKGARMSTSDLVLSVGTLQRGITVLESSLTGGLLSPNKTSVQTLSNLYQDAADRLSLIRTPDEIRHAVVLMERSFCYQKMVSGSVEKPDEIFNPEQCPAILAQMLRQGQ